MDLVPVQPEETLQNCFFEVGNIVSDLGAEKFDDNNVSLVHMRYSFLHFVDSTSDIRIRLVHAGIHEDEWPKVIDNVY